MDADAYNARELAAARITPQDISTATRLAQKSLGLRVDGKMGKDTRGALRGLADNATSEPPDQLGEFDGTLLRIPKSRAEILEVFGNPGTLDKPDKAWRKRQIITVRDLPGVPHRLYVQVHRLAEPYLREGLRRAAEDSEVKVERCGVHVHRAIRGRTTLSLHSWGIAADINPSDNRAHRFERGSGPVPWSEEWTKLWPDGVDLAFVEAMEDAVKNDVPTQGSSALVPAQEGADQG